MIPPAAAILNRALGRFDLELARKSKHRSSEPREDSLKLPRDVPPPPGSQEHLRPDHPRLLELKRRYLDHPAASPSLWTESFVDRNVSLRRFREGNAYVWQTEASWIVTDDGSFEPVPTREVNYVLSAYYVRQVDELGLHERLTDDPLFGNLVVEVDGGITSRDLLDSILEINFLERHLELSRLTEPTILDIGAGYGRLAHRLVEGLPNIRRVICADAVPESTFISDYYLRFRGVSPAATVAPLDEVTDMVSEIRPEIAVNVHSFSECPYDVVCWWLDLLRAGRVRYLMIVPNTHHLLLSRERDGAFRDFTGALSARGYRLLVREPKYRGATSVQQFGIFPTHYHLFELGD